MNILITCPPMLRQMGNLAPLLTSRGFDFHCPDVVQTLSEAELIDLVPQFDGWIIGDDPATRRVFQAGRRGRLKAAVKWGVGTDNVDFDAAKDLELPITNTPGMFGNEVADIAVAYVIGLARDLFLVDRRVRSGAWPKPSGISLMGKVAGVVGFGDIGRNIAKRLTATGMRVVVYDPALSSSPGEGTLARWPDRIGKLDFLILACSLTAANRHMVDDVLLAKVRPGLRIVNVSRGPLIDESALVTALQSGQVHSAALDVFEVEPLPKESRLRGFDRCIFGTHNGSNTVEAVERTSRDAVEKLTAFLLGERLARKLEAH